MVLNSNPDKVRKITDSPIKTKTLKHASDTTHGITALLWLVFFTAFLVLWHLFAGIRRGVIPHACAVLGIVYCIKLCIYHFSAGNYKKLKNYCRQNNIDFADVEKDWENRRIYGPALCAVGDRYFICIDGIIPIEKICWIFFSDYNLHNEGKNVKKDFIAVCTADGAVAEYIFTPDYAAAFLSDMHEKHPEIILGYSFELEKLFANERNEFRTKAVSIRPESIYEMKSSTL